MIERLLRLVGRWARKPVNHTSWVAVVTPTDRPKSVRNRFLIELFCGVVWVVALPFWHFCWCRGFCHRTESDLFLFLSLGVGTFVIGLGQISSFLSFNISKTISRYLEFVTDFLAFKIFPAFSFQTLESKSLAKSQVAFILLKAIFPAVLRRENKDDRHQGNHRHYLPDDKYIFLDEMKYCIVLRLFLIL